jgi:periplasmic protein TonB
MFDDALHSSWDERSRRGLTTLTSFGVEALVVAVLLIVPLLRPIGVPLLRHLSTPISLSAPAPAPLEVRTRSGAAPVMNRTASEIVLRQPAQIPRQIVTGNDPAPPPLAPSGGYIPGIPGAGGQHGVLSSFGTAPAPIIPRGPASTEHTVRLSHMSEGDLVHKVLPRYPALARSARIQGPVILQAMIGKSGAIENLRLLSGHPILAPAAIEAVRQWRYRPYILNGEPVEVETQITVNFSLAGN